MVPARKISAWVECVPKGKGRPRMDTVRGRTYTPKATEQAEAEQAELLRPYTPSAPLEGALACRLIYALPIPASWPKKERARARLGEVMPTGKPDVDNAGKLTLDVLTGLGWWKDDAQVVSLVVEKVYAERPGVRVEVWEVR